MLSPGSTFYIVKKVLPGQYLSIPFITQDGDNPDYVYFKSGITYQELDMEVLNLYKNYGIYSDNVHQGAWVSVNGDITPCPPHCVYDVGFMLGWNLSIEDPLTAVLDGGGYVYVGMVDGKPGILCSSNREYFSTQQKHGMLAVIERLRNSNYATLMTNPRHYPASFDVEAPAFVNWSTFMEGLDNAYIALVFSKKSEGDSGGGE